MRSHAPARTQEDDWGPSMGGGRGRSGRRFLKIVVVVVLVALLAVLLVGFWISRQIPREEVDHLARFGSPMNVLVVGTDSRADLTREQQRDLGVGGAGGERADTIFVMSVRGGDVAMLAFPRDLWVTRCDGTEGRINVAIEASPGCLVQTVNDLSGLEIHHFMRMTFGGFVDVVDAVGGVELCLDEAISDRSAHIDLPAGCQRLEGSDALGYVRVRKIDNDLQRIQRQQEFVKALSEEVASPSTLLNPLRMYRFGDEAGDAVSVDESMGMVSMARLGWGARGMSQGRAVTHTVPGHPEQRGQAAILVPDEAEAERLFARFRDGSIFDEARAGIAPEDVRVTVYNATDISGLAGEVAEQLEAEGYDLVDIGNADPREETLLQYPLGEEAAAEMVAEDVPGDVTLEESPDVAQITVLLGPAAGG